MSSDGPLLEPATGGASEADGVDGCSGWLAAAASAAGAFLSDAASPLSDVAPWSASTTSPATCRCKRSKGATSCTAHITAAQL